MKYFYILIFVCITQIAFSQTYSVQSALTYLEWKSPILEGNEPGDRYIWLDLHAQEEAVWIDETNTHYFVYAYVKGEYLTVAVREKSSPYSWDYIKFAAALEWFKFATGNVNTGEMVTNRIAEIMANPQNF